MVAVEEAMEYVNVKIIHWMSCSVCRTDIAKIMINMCIYILDYNKPRKILSNPVSFPLSCCAWRSLVFPDSVNLLPHNLYMTYGNHSIIRYI